MRSIFSILPYINRNKVKADGTTAVLCRITIDGKSSTMATGIYCRPEDWNSKTGAIRTVRENNRLQEFRKSVELAYDEIWFFRSFVGWPFSNIKLSTSSFSFKRLKINSFVI